MFNFIVRAFQRHTLRKLPSLNKKKYHSLEDARSVAIVFNSQESEIAEAIGILDKELKKFGISYKGLGISFTKDETTNSKLDHYPYIVQILKKETNWLSIPTIEQAENFYKGEYDILFDLSLQPSFAIEYSIKRCKCGMIVGYCPEREEMYDLCIKGGEGKREARPSLAEYVKQSIQYLTIIKSK